MRRLDHNGGCLLRSGRCIGDGTPPVDAGALGGLCRCRWGQVLAPHLPVPPAPPGRPHPHRTLQAVAGEDLGKPDMSATVLTLRYRTS